MVKAALALSLPGAVAMAGAVALKAIGPGAAVLVWLFFAVGGALVARAWLREATQVAHYVNELTRGATDLPPDLGHSAAASTLSAAIARLSRSWGERNEALSALVAASEMILDSLPDPLIMLDAQRRVVRGNLAAGSLFRSAMIGRDLAELVRSPEILKAADQAVGARVPSQVEFTLPVPVERHLSARFEPLSVPTRDGIVAILSFHDLTAIKKSEQMRADFVANASHELRTPLTTLIGFIETLRGPAADDREAQERFLAIMREQALRMSRLVADLLSLSRIELNEHSRPTAPVELARVLRGVADALELQAKAKRIKVMLDLPEGPMEVPGDPDQLTQLFQNLFDNAIKYGRNGSLIRIKLDRPRPGSVRVAVTDQGDGIAREHLPRLTERFYRVDSARSRKLGGTGLGLAIVKHVVNRHRGTLGIESRPGEGSTFAVTLPADGGPIDSTDAKAHLG